MIRLLSGIWAVLILSSCAYQGINQYPLDRGYPLFENLLDTLNELGREYPEIFRHRIIGFSGSEKLPIYAVELGTGARNVIIIGQHHADEVIGVAISLGIAEEFCRQSRDSGETKRLLSEYRIWIVPTINPEGWRLVSRGEARIKRKNNRDTDGNGKLDIRTDGVDLNRNYPIFWDLDGETKHMSSYFKGSSPASEAEVKAIIALGRKVEFELGIFYHSSITGALNEKIFLPAVDTEDAAFKELAGWAQFYAENSPRDYFGGAYSLHRGVTSKVGNARNFFYHGLGAGAMLIEVGGVNRQGQSIIHPRAKMLKRIVKRHCKSFAGLLNKMSKL